jgi:hypothetical protein
VNNDEARGVGPRLPAGRPTARPTGSGRLVLPNEAAAARPGPSSWCQSRPHPRDGHTYTTEYVDGWNAVMRPVGMTPQDLGDLKKIIAAEGQAHTSQSRVVHLPFISAS